MRVVHYTKPFFKLSPITIKNGDGEVEPVVKPRGGLWCSPLNSKYGWKDWCKGRSFDIERKQKVLLDIDLTHFVVIDSKEDMETKLPWYRIYDILFAIDFEKLVKGAIEGVYLTEKGQRATSWMGPFDRSLYGWDCETILILNEKCIKKVSFLG